MQKRVDTADISVLIFSYSCANFLGVYAQTNFKHCAISTVLWHSVLATCYCTERLIQGNSRCFGANFKMSRNTQFLC